MLKVSFRRWVVATLSLLFCGVVLEGRAGPPNTTDFLSGRFDIAMKDCHIQIESGQFDTCLTELRSIEAEVTGGATEVETEIKARIGYYISVVEAYMATGELDQERPSNYYTPLFRAMSAIPEKYFPYEDAIPLWNKYLREEVGRARFRRYRRLRLIVRADEAQKALQDEFASRLQPEVLRYGYSILDPTTSFSSDPDTLLKLRLKGALARESTDPRLQYKTIYRLTVDIESFKFVTARKRIAPSQIELEVPAASKEMAREMAIEQGATELTRQLFYQNLKQMFPVGGAVQ